MGERQRSIEREILEMFQESECVCVCVCVYVCSALPCSAARPSRSPGYPGCCQPAAAASLAPSVAKACAAARNKHVWNQLTATTTLTDSSSNTNTSEMKFEQRRST